MKNYVECIKLIAEVKTQSPYGYKSEKSFDELLDIAIEKGDIISIHTNPIWGGDFKLLEKARKKTKKPILAKGLHLNDWEFWKATEYGADYVLTVGRVPIGLTLSKVWYEPLFLDEFKENLKMPLISAVDAVVINQRNLLSGENRNTTDFFELFLSKYPVEYTTLDELFTKWRNIERPQLYLASNIKHKRDVLMRYDGAIIGTHLTSF